MGCSLGGDTGLAMPAFHQRRALNYYKEGFANLLEKNRCLKPVQVPGSAAAATSVLAFA